MTSTSRIPVFIACAALSAALAAEDVTWQPVPDATFYRLSWGVVGGPTNVVNVATNLQTWTNRVSGATFSAPGVALPTLPLNQRHFFFTTTVQSNATTAVVSSPSSVIFYTPRPSPDGQQVGGE